jgi:hypothetical protein
MANRVGTVVSRLIRQRSYTAGDLNTIEKKLEEATTRLREAQVACRAIKKEQRSILKKLSELDAEIARQSAIQVADIAARRLTPRRIRCRHGSINAALVDFLKHSGQSVTTTEVIQYMARTFDLPIDTPDDWRDAREWTRKKLKPLAKQGAIVRLHDPSDSLLGRWQWIGLD